MSFATVRTSPVLAATHRIGRRSPPRRLDWLGNRSPLIIGAPLAAALCVAIATSRSACEPEEMDMAELLAMPGIREECILRSNVGFMALHGGSQDRGTEQIAKRAADQVGASYYAIVHPPGLRVHLTSRLHNPHHSAQLRSFLEHVDVAISVHGFGRDGFALWFDPDRGLVIEPYGPAIRGKQTGPLRGIIVGGLNAQLLDAARRAVARALRRLSRRRRAGAARVPSRQSGQPSIGPRCPGRAAPGPARNRRFRRDLVSQPRRDRQRGGGFARRTGDSSHRTGSHDFTCQSTLYRLL